MLTSRTATDAMNQRSVILYSDLRVVRELKRAPERVKLEQDCGQQQETRDGGRARHPATGFEPPIAHEEKREADHDRDRGDHALPVAGGQRRV